MNRLFFHLYLLIGNDFSGILLSDEEVEKADTRCAKSHNLELSKDIISCSKILVVARVIASNYGAHPILGEFLYHWLNCMPLQVIGRPPSGDQTNPKND